MALPPKCPYGGPQPPDEKCIFPRYLCTTGEAGTSDANQDRDGQKGAGGADMSVVKLHNRLEGEPWAKRASGGGKRERL